MAEALAVVARGAQAPRLGWRRPASWVAQAPAGWLWRRRPSGPFQKGGEAEEGKVEAENEKGLGAEKRKSCFKPS